MWTSCGSDDVYGTLDERTEESERSKAFEIETEIEPKSPFEENFEHAAISSDAASASNTSKSEQTTLQTRESNLFRLAFCSIYVPVFVS